MQQKVKALAVTLLACLMAAPLAPAQEAEPQAVTRPAEGLLFVGSAHNEPFSFLDKQGRPVGFDVEVMVAIAREMGRKITVKLLDGDLAREAVQSGQADGLIGLGIVPGGEDPRQEWVLCGPTVPREYRMLVHEDTKWIGPHANHVALNGTRVAVVADDPVEALFENNRGVTIEFVPKADGGCLWVIRKRVTAFVADGNVIRYNARKSQLKGVKFVGRPIYEVSKYGPALPIRGDSVLVSTLRDAIRRLNRPDGELEKLRSKWFACELDRTPVWRQRWVRDVVLVAMAGLVLVAAGVAWRRGIRAGVAERTRKLRAEEEVLRKQLNDLRARLEQVETTSSTLPAGQEPIPVAKGTPVGVAPMELNELLRSCADVLENALGESISLSVHLSEDTPAVLADAEQVRLMLVNLCTNARDAIHRRRKADGQAPSRVWIDTRPAKQDEKPPNVNAGDKTFVAISVRDTGCGIEQSLVKNIFQPGYTTRADAAGRGLAFVYEAVAQHNGWIDVESAPDRGATFSIYLPAAEM